MTYTLQWHINEDGTAMVDLSALIKDIKADAYVEFREACERRPYDDPWDVCAALLNKLDGAEE